MKPTRTVLLGLSVVTALAAIALGSAGAASGSTTGRAASPVKVGMIYSKTGPFAPYGAEFRQGFDAGLSYVTHGTGKVNGHPIDVSWADDAFSIATGINDAKTFIGEGYQILGGTQDSSIADAISSLAAENHVLYIAGDAADDSVTGANHYTFRAGRQTAQDVLAAKAYLGKNGRGKTMTIFAQDYAFGESYLTDAQTLLKPLGYKIDSVLVPLTATNFTAYALKAKATHPKVLFVAWAGTTGTAMWQALEDEGLLKSTTVVTGLANIATYPLLGDAATKVNYISLYFYQCCHNAANKYLIDYVKHEGAVPDLFDADGFVTAQMISRAVSTGGGKNVEKMISSLEGWSFTAPKGTEVIRPLDHAMLQPMFRVKLNKSGSQYVPSLIASLTAKQTAPPIGNHVK